MSWNDQLICSRSVYVSLLVASITMSALAKTQKAKALDFVSQAEATQAKKSWFSSSKERNQEDAAELYMQAANAYKVGGFNHEAGETYKTAGALYRDKLSNPNEAAKCYSQAGTFFDAKSKRKNAPDD